MSSQGNLRDQCRAVWATQDPAATAQVEQLWKRINSRLVPTDGDCPSTAGEVQHQFATTPAAQAKTSPERSRRSWATASIFISSTFKDFFVERECLVKRVFPALREWCEARRIALYDCDLRWGVPQDCTGAEAVRTCLELIDRCHSETAGRGAFFLGLVGNRFGWVPAESELTPDLLDRYGWVSGCSVTQMEVLHGAMDRLSPNALFMLRDPACCAGLPERQRDSFVEPPGSLAAAHVARQRLEIVERFPAGQVGVYSPEYAGTSSSVHDADSKERIQLSGLEVFETQVLEFFRRAIADQFPDHVEPVNAAPSEPLDTEVGESNDVHINYMLSLVGSASGQDQCLGLLTNFVETGELSMASFKLFGDSADHIAFGLPGVKSVVVSGDAGIGKSTILARLGRHFLDRKGFEVLAHFAQLSPASNDRRTLQRKMKSFLKGLLPDAEAAKVSEDSSVSDLFNAIMRVRRTILILIDAFECFYEVSHVGELLPVAWPQNVRCVVSCRSKDLDRCFSERSVCLYELEGLEAEARSMVCQSYLGGYGKRLDADQLSALLGKAGASNPLWLSQACAELRVHGDFASLTQRIADLPGDARVLLRAVAARVAAEDRDGSAAALLALVCVARVGLWEKHARSMVRFAVDWQRRRNGDCSRGENGERSDALPDLPLADYLHLLRNTRPFLRTIAREATAIAFRHELSRSAVQSLLLDSTELTKRWHSLTADFILTMGSSADDCLARDLPYHLYWSDRRSELHRILQGEQGKRHFGLRLSHLTASGVYNSWRCRVPKVSEKSPLASLMACSFCVNKPSRTGSLRAQSCIYCGLLLNPSRPGSAVLATTCQQHRAPNSSFQRCWFCDQLCGAVDATPLQVCNFCNSSASSYLCYQPVMETDNQFAQVVRNQTKKFGMRW